MQFYKSDNESMVWLAFNDKVRMQPSDGGTGELVYKSRY